MSITTRTLPVQVAPNLGLLLTCAPEDPKETIAVVIEFGTCPGLPCDTAHENHVSAV